MNPINENGTPQIMESQSPRKRVMLTTAPKPKPGTTALHYGDLRHPLGLGFIAAFLKQYGHEVIIVDNYVRPRNMHKEISDFRPDIIGLYVYSPGYYVALDLIEEIRQVTHCTLVCGGPHVSLLPETMPDTVDHLVMGEGEEAMLEIVEGRMKDRFVSVERRRSLEELPFPDYRNFVKEPYNWRFDLYGSDADRVFTMHTSRSCPYRCSFCGVASIWGRNYTFFSGERIVQEIDKLVERYGCNGIYFREDLFTVNKNRVREMCEHLLTRDYKIEWAAESRADCVDPSLMELMKKSGCVGLYVGVESGSESGLKKVAKDLTLETMRDFFKISHEFDVRIYATFCMATPHETEEELQETMQFIEEVKPFSFDKFAYLPLPRSADSDYIEKHKLYYHREKSGIMYTEKFREAARRLYSASDPRIRFLAKQEELLKRMGPAFDSCHGMDVEVSETFKTSNIAKNNFLKPLVNA